MVSYDTTSKVAAVQAAPVWFDLPATVDKTVALIAEAARNGAELVAFPEVFIPGYPYHLWLDSPMASVGGFAGRYHQNSLAMDDPLLLRILDAAKQHHIAVVIGISERDAGSLYMSQLFIGQDGTLIGKRRKLKPTHVERTLFGEGDGSDITVFDMPMGRVGALNCWEHFQPLTKYAMYSQHEQIHVASWPGMSIYQPAVWTVGAEAQVIATKMYAMEGQTFVVCSTQLVDQAAQDLFLSSAAYADLLKPGGGFARILGPDGVDLVEPLPDDVEGILYADVNLAAIPIAKQFADPVGHYSRPDVFSLLFNQGETSVVSIREATVTQQLSHSVTVNQPRADSAVSEEPATVPA